MSRCLVAGVLIPGTLLIALAYASAFLGGGASWGVWCMIAGVTGLSLGVTALGALRQGRRSPVVIGALALTGVCIAAGFALALLLPDEGVAERLVLGFPVRAAAVIWLVGVVPLFVFPVAYAMSFDDLTLRDDDLERVRRLRRERDA
jgi:hypothetical protein